MAETLKFRLTAKRYTHRTVAKAQIRSQDSKRRANVNEERHSGRATEILVVVSDGLATLTCTRTRDQGGGIRVYF